MADATGLSPDTARKALSRAIERIQSRTSPRQGAREDD
jgi:DNA-directed RNA polymerase specialized sigma24 family protein